MKKTVRGQKLKEKALRRAIYELLRDNREKGFTARQIIKRIKVSNSKNAIQKQLNALERVDKVQKVQEGRYMIKGRPASNSKENHGRRERREQRSLSGIVDMTKSGAAFIVCPDLNTDVYVPVKYMRSAQDGDEVLVELTRLRQGRRPEGKIVDILKRNKSTYSGIYRAFKNHNMVLAESKNSKLDIVVSNEVPHDAKDYDRVVIEISEWPSRPQQSPVGVITQILGKAGSNDAEMQGILVDNGFNLEFSEETMKESEVIAAEAKIETQEGRLDLRDVATLTIDPEDAKDFDDALSCQILENGDIVIGIHIADVGEYVKSGSAIDKEAAERGNSVYLVDRVLPMLPEVLSNGLCSLRPNEDKYGFSVLVTFDGDYKIKSHRFTKSIICSDQRFTYQEAQAIIDGEKGPMQKEVLLLNDISRKLRENRYNEGSIGFETEEVRIRLDETGRPIEMYVKERIEANLLIEDFMLLANKLVATRMGVTKGSNPVPFPYRIHDLPDAARLHDFALLAAEFGFKFDLQGLKNIVNSFNELMELARNDDHYKPLVPMAIRSMSKAEYNTDNIGHFGLGFEYYCHFTSPIRRYADLLVHRILFENLDKRWQMKKDQLDAICTHISSQERKAMDAERESVKYKQAEFMADRIGEDYIGVVTGIIERGFFVMIKENHCEGMIVFESLDESFMINPLYSAIEGRKSGRKIKLGDEVPVIVMNADPWTRRIELTLAE
jgi:ribonuclease R